jgi:RNA polymerase sigma-70 factor (ECF subfamily)
MISSNKDECCSPHQITADFYDKILGYVIKRIQNEEVAKDITQEVMGRMIDAYDKKIQIENIRAWLFQVTRNVIADRYRKKDLVDFVDDDFAKNSTIEQGPEISTADFIIPMIKQLPEEYSIPLYLSDIENMKQADIAKKLNLSLSATKMRCQRARKKLHELFLECCNIEYTEDGAFAHCTLKQNCKVLLKEESRLNKDLNSS